MTLETDLLAAVLAAPDDDAPRLVYADWLLEHADRDRGEFIQIQCALGRPLVGARGLAILRDGDAKMPASREELEKRETALLKKHHKRWIAPIRPFIRTWSWRRGFVDRVEADGAKFIDGAEAIFASTPLFHAELTGFKPPILEKLAETRALRSLRSLSLARQRIHPKTAHVLQSPHLAGLVALDVWGNPLGDAGVSALAASEHLGALRTLNLAHSEISIEGLEALSRAQFFPRLTSLTLDVGYDPNGARALGRRAGEILARAESLVSLSLARCGIGDDGIEALAASPAMKNLEELGLHGNQISARGAIALARSPHLSKLRTVHGLVGYEGDLDPEAEKALSDRFGDGCY